MAALKHPQILLASALADGEALFLGGKTIEEKKRKKIK
jgi:hypothetical protein